MQLTLLYDPVIVCNINNCYYITYSISNYSMIHIAKYITDKQVFLYRGIFTTTLSRLYKEASRSLVIQWAYDVISRGLFIIIVSYHISTTLVFTSYGLIMVINFVVVRIH